MTTKLVRDPRASIMPRYTSLSGSILPQYASIGEADVITIDPVKVTADPNEAEHRAALMAGALFFTGLVLGYIWGGVTGGVHAT